MKYRTLISLARERSSVAIPSGRPVVAPLAANDATTRPQPATTGSSAQPLRRGARPGWNSRTLSIMSGNKPKPGDVFFLGAPTDAHAPEFTGYHPVVILRGPVSMDPDTGTVIYVPLTSSSPLELAAHIHAFAVNPIPGGKGKACWAICDHVSTASITRLEYCCDDWKRVVPHVARRDLDAIMDRIHSVLPAPTQRSVSKAR